MSDTITSTSQDSERVQKRARRTGPIVPGCSSGCKQFDLHARDFIDALAVIWCDIDSQHILQSFQKLMKEVVDPKNELGERGYSGYRCDWVVALCKEQNLEPFNIRKSEKPWDKLCNAASIIVEGSFSLPSTTNERAIFLVAEIMDQVKSVTDNWGLDEPAAVLGQWASAHQELLEKVKKEQKRIDDAMLEELRKEDEEVERLMKETESKRLEALQVGFNSSGVSGGDVE